MVFCQFPSSVIRVKLESKHAECAAETRPVPCQRRTLPKGPCKCLLIFQSLSLFLHHDRLQALWVLDVDRLHVAVELLLGALLVVTSPGDADAQPVWDTLDTLLPDLLIQLGVEADVGRTLFSC